MSASSLSSHCLSCGTLRASDPARSARSTLGKPCGQSRASCRPAGVKVHCSASSPLSGPEASKCGRRTSAGIAIGLASALAGLTRAPDALADGINSFVYTGKSASSEKATEQIKFKTIVNDESGFEVSIPEGWELEAPGGRLEYHPPRDYAGRRIVVEVLPFAKLKEASFASLYTPEEYARVLADRKTKDLNQGASAKILATGERDNARYYYFNYDIESFEPQRVWGVSAVGLGQNESARKFKLRQQVVVTCQMPVKEITSEADSEILRQVVASFNFTDVFGPYIVR